MLLLGGVNSNAIEAETAQRVGVLAVRYGAATILPDAVAEAAAGAVEGDIREWIEAGDDVDEEGFCG